MRTQHQPNAAMNETTLFLSLSSKESRHAKLMGEHVLVSEEDTPYLSPVPFSSEVPEMYLVEGYGYYVSLVSTFYEIETILRTSKEQAASDWNLIFSEL